MPVGRAPVAPAQQREPVLKAAVDLLDRHDAHLGRGELDRQRQAVKPADDARDYLLGQPRIRPGGDRPFAEQLSRVGRAELAQRVDALGRDRQRRPAGGEHPQVGRGGDEERGELGRRLDQVLAVVKHQQPGRLAEALRDA